MFNNLSQQPEAVRKKAAYLITGVISIIIVSAWLLITSYNMRQAVAPDREKDQANKSFRQSLPSLRQNDSIQTELSKQQAAKSGNILNDSE